LLETAALLLSINVIAFTPTEYSDAKQTIVGNLLGIPSSLSSDVENTG
jgi:hypothetical protein